MLRLASRARSRSRAGEPPRIGRIGRVVAVAVIALAWAAVAIGGAILLYQMFELITLSYWPPVRMQDLALAMDVYLPLPDGLLRLPLAALLLPPGVIAIFLHGEWSSARRRHDPGKPQRARSNR